MTDQNFKIISFNCKSLYSRLAEIKNYIQTTKPHCVCLTETWLHKDIIPNFKNYQAYWKHRERGQGGGVGILVRSDIPSLPTDLQTYDSPLEVQSVIIQIKHFRVQLVNIYNPSGSTNYETFNKYFQQIHGQFIIVGDFNGHHNMWSLPNTPNNNSGNAIEQILDNYSHIILNTPPKLITFLHSATGAPSVLDLCFSSSMLAPDIHIQTGPDLGSDHLPVIITLSRPPQSEPILTRKRFKTKGVTWSHWSRGLPTLEWNENATVSSANENLVKSIKSSSYIIPETSGKYSPTFSKLWWNAECSRLVAKRRYAKNRLKKCQNRENIMKLREAENEVKFYTAELKRKSWQEYVSTLTSTTPITEVWNKIRSIRNTYTPPASALKEQNSIITSPGCIAEIFSEYFKEKFNIPYHSAEQNDMFLCTQNAIIDESPEEYNTEFTEFELRCAIQKLKNTSPGLDNIENIFLRNLPDAYLLYTLKLINKSWINEDVPKEWKKGLLVPILKPGKDSSYKESNRPIMMLSCIAKLAERLVNNRLDWYSERNLILLPQQAGFRREHSTDDQIALLQDNIRRSIHADHHCLVVFLDLAGAFDAVNHRVLLYKLSRLGYKGRILGWLQSYLQDRTFQVLYRGHLSKIKTINTGVPQGGILSPFLFNVMMADLPISDGIRVSVFADDIAVCASGVNPIEVNARIQNQLNKIVEWTLKWGQSLNPNKSKLMLFSSSTLQTLPITIHNQNLEYVSNHKFLGLVFDSPKLTWKNHINHLKSSCSKRISILKSISHHHWGSDRQTLLMLYKSLVRSRLDYGCQFYNDAGKSLLKTLDPIQNQCLRIGAGVRLTSPIKALLVETTTPSLANRRNFLSLKYYSRVTEKHYSSPILKSLTSYKNSLQKHNGFFSNCLKIFQEWNISPPSYTSCFARSPSPPWLDLSKIIITDFPIDHKTASPNNVQQVFKNDISSKYTDHTEIYTDGSKSQHCTASAYVIPSKTYNFYMELENNASILTAELLAIDQALEFCIKNQSTKYVIYTDSLSSLLLLAAPEIKTYRFLSYNIITKLCLMYNEIHLQWIPSHMGITGNEEADKTAKSKKNVLFKYCKLPKEDYFNLYKQKLFSAWQEEYCQSFATDSKGLHFYNIKNKIEHWPWSSHGDRRVESGLARLRMGHAGLAQHLHRIQMNPTPLCACGDVESVNHYLLNCPLHDIHRSKITQELLSANINEPLSLKLLLGGSDLPLNQQNLIANEVKCFLISTGRLSTL